MHVQNGIKEGSGPLQSFLSLFPPFLILPRHSLNHFITQACNIQKAPLFKIPQARCPLQTTSLHQSTHQHQLEACLSRSRKRGTSWTISTLTHFLNLQPPLRLYSLQYLLHALPDLIFPRGPQIRPAEPNAPLMSLNMGKETPGWEDIKQFLATHQTTASHKRWEVHRLCPLIPK